MNFSTRPAGHRRGFTLIELLVVIAIIAILAAILFPVFARAREAARASSCLSNTKQMGNAVLMYVQDYDEIYPWMWQGVPTNPAWVHVPINQTASSNYQIWAEWIYPYVKNDGVFQCPSYKRTQAQMPYSTFPVSYNYNGNASGGVSGAAMAQIDAPATTVVLYDGYTMDAWWYAQDHASLLSGIPSWTPASPSPQTWTATTWNVVRRHNSGANVAFADGHSKWVNKATPQMFTRVGDPD